MFCLPNMFARIVWSSMSVERICAQGSLSVLCLDHIWNIYNGRLTVWQIFWISFDGMCLNCVMHQNGFFLEWLDVSESLRDIERFWFYLVQSFIKNRTGNVSGHLIPLPRFKKKKKKLTILKLKSFFHFSLSFIHPSLTSSLVFDIDSRKLVFFSSILEESGEGKCVRNRV